MQIEQEKYSMVQTDGIIFDMDGTIWDTCKQVTYSWNEVLKHLNLSFRFTSEQIQSCMGLLMEDFAAKLMPDLEPEFRLNVLKQCCDYENEYIAKVGGTLYPKLMETLEILSHKYPLFIVSNCQAGYIEAFFEAHQTEKFFKDYENPGRSGLAKAENIQLIAKRNHLTHPVYIGDTQGDLNACEKAGVPFVFASYGFGEVPLEKCVAVAEKFADLETIFNCAG